MKKAVYAGSFDPITHGHLWMIQQGAAIFDTLVVAIGVNPDKPATFSLDQRLDFLRQATVDVSHCAIDSFHDQFLVRYARSVGAGYILRGIRNEHDYAYERAMRHVNSDLDGQIVTVFLMPPRGIAEVSSSMVKGLVGPAGWEEVVRPLVPPAVFEALQHRHRATGT